MAKKITRNDISEEDIFKGIRDSAEATLVVLDKMEASLKESANIGKGKIQKIDPKSLSDLKEFNGLTAEAIKIQKEAEKLAQEKSRTQKVLAQTDEALVRIAEKKVKAQKEELSAYAKLSKELNDNRKAYKDLAVQNKQNTKEGQELLKTLTAQDKKLKEIDATVGQHQRSVGNYNGAISKLRGALNQLGLAFGVFELIKGAGQTIVEFDSKVADLKAITGLKEGSKDLNLLKDSAIELGKQVQGGAKEVIEAYKLIGSAKPELLENASALDKVTKSAILLSQASGMELPASATALTDAMNQFGASAEEADKFVNVLANGAKFGAVEIPQVTEALLKFGAVAKTSNVSIEESTALIEALGDKGQKGAEAGTALRNVMLKLSAPDALPIEAQKRMKDLGISFDDLTDKSKPFSERLKALKPLLKDEASLVKVFGMENVVTAKNLLGSTQRIEQLNKQMKTNGTATEQANERTKTLSFAINKVKESYNGYILKMSEGVDATKGLTWFVTKLAENFDTIISVLGKLARMFAVYKASMMALKMKDRIDEWVKYKKSVKESSDALNEGQKGAKAFGGALKAIGFSVAIELAIALASKIWDIASGAEQARENMARWEASTQTAINNANKLLDERDRKAKEYNAELERQRKLQLANAQTEKEKAVINAKYDALKLEYTTKTTNQLIKEKTLLNERKQTYKDELENLSKLQKQYEKTGAGIDEFNLKKETLRLADKYGIKADKALFGGRDYTGLTDDIMSQLRSSIGGVNEKMKIYNYKIAENKELQKDEASNLKVANVEINKQTKEIKDLNRVKDDQIDKEIELAELDAERKRQRALDEKDRLDDIDLEIEQNAKDEALRKEIEDELKQELALDKKRKKEEEDKIKRQEVMNNIVQVSTDFFVKKSNERIAQLDKEIQASEQHYNTLQTLAENGNINAKESLELELANQIESNKQKEKELKKQQRIEMMKTAYSTYQAKVQGGSKQPLADTIKDVAMLNAFVASLPTFFDGIEDTGKGGGIDGKGGFLSVLHPNERVVPKAINEKLVGISNQELGSIAEQIKLNNMPFNKGVLDLNFGTDKIVERLDSLENAIKNKPETNIQLESIVNGAMTIVRQSKGNGQTITNRYKVRS